MMQVIAERLDGKTGDIVAARTLRGNSAECHVVGNEIVFGEVIVKAGNETITIRVSADPNDYQQARVYDNDELVESLVLREGTVTYIDEAQVAAVRRRGSDR